MYKNKKVLAVIPARIGSKGIKKKNLSLLNGEPLIGHSIKESKLSKYIDQLIVSTDSKEIKKVTESYHCEVPFLRPKRLSQDVSKSIDLFRIPEVIMYFNLGKLSINILVMGVRSLIINKASKSSSSTIA